MNTGKKQLSLSQLAATIRQTLDTHLEISYWVVAEISELKENTYSGHCFLELIEKDDAANNIKARMRATIWANQFRLIKPYFESATGMALAPGIKVLLKAVVEFHESFGLSLNIRDIEPAFTIGEMAMKRQETLLLLQADGVAQLNKELEIPVPAKNIALITSPEAAGYRDFMNEIENNRSGYCFHIKLFKAVMQGEKAPQSIMEALGRIFNYVDIFDVVVILRGGGAVADLSCFDDYELAFTAAQYPLPIITGIGHDKDETVLDLIAHTKLKTPTAVAGYFIDHFSELESYSEGLMDSIIDYTKTSINENLTYLTLLQSRIKPQSQSALTHHTNSLTSISKDFSRLASHHIGSNRNNLGRFSLILKKSAGYLLNGKNEKLRTLTSLLRDKSHQFFVRNMNQLDKSEIKIQYQNPVRVLEKGYTLTLKEGKVIKSATELTENDTIETRFSDGAQFSKVVTIQQK
jgi:exodeoxyribonuclease VII large subunit